MQEETNQSKSSRILLVSYGMGDVLDDAQCMLDYFIRTVPHVGENCHIWQIP
jgi:hypothetical protein